MGCKREAVDCVRTLAALEAPFVVSVLTATGVLPEDANDPVEASNEDAVGCLRRGDEMMLEEIPAPLAIEVLAESRDGKFELLEFWAPNGRPACRRFAVIHGWRMAGSGLSRRSGSQARHLAMKSTNSSSSVFRTA